MAVRGYRAASNTITVFEVGIVTCMYQCILLTIAIDNDNKNNMVNFLSVHNPGNLSLIQIL